jgi:hypothetical protein
MTPLHAAQPAMPAVHPEHLPAQMTSMHAMPALTELQPMQPVEAIDPDKGPRSLANTLMIASLAIVIPGALGAAVAYAATTLL